MMLKPHQPRIICPKQEIVAPSGVLQQLLLLPALAPNSPNNILLNKPQMPSQKPYFSSVKGYLADDQGVGPICRTCYRVIYDNNFIKLYEEETQETSEKLRNMLKQVVRTIDLEIYVEPIMCIKCVKKLFDCHEFLTRCWDTEVKFNHWVSQRKRVRQEEVNLLILVESSTNGDELEDSILTKEPPKRAKVEIVDLTTSEEAPNNDNPVKMDKSNTDLDDWVLTDHNYAGFSQTTPENKKKSDYKVKLSRAERRRRNRAKQDRKKGPFLCELCGYLAKSHKSFSMHLESHESNSIEDGLHKCTKCPYVSKDTYRLNIHVAQHAEPTHKCTECGKRFKFEKALTLHIKNIHLNNSGCQQCHICGKSFKYQTSLRVHLRCHNPEKSPRYVCELCGKRSASRQAFQKHLLSHSREKSYMCEDCGRQLKHKTTFRRHRQIYHENNGKFICDVCNRSFWREEHLTRHKVKHVTFGEENKCNICQMYYSSRGNLLNHLAEAHGKLFECQDCGVKFKIQRALKNHNYMYHGGGARFRCEICKKGYRKKGTLLQHAFKVHGFKAEEEEDFSESVETPVEEHSQVNFEDFNLDKENVLVEPIEVFDFF